MENSDVRSALDIQTTVQSMDRLIAELYPICRSITGNGLRETLAAIGKHIPLELHEVPSGTKVLDWTVPKEWNIRDAFIIAPNGEKVVNFQDSNLHVVGYSTPVDTKLPLAELRPRLFSLPEHPDWVPYRTSYYTENWGFCLTQRRLDGLEDGDYKVRIDSTLEDGSLSYGECYLAGSSPNEFLISCHCCHPSLCNDNLSGIALSTFLAKHLEGLKLRYSYRFLFIPGTIGSITWLARNEYTLSRIKHGLVVTGVGDPGALSYKKSRRGGAVIDRAAAIALRDSGKEHQILDFSPYGYDERQYCSPGFDLPVGCLMRSPHGTYPEYHTSADDLSFVQPQYLAESLDLALSIIDVIEKDRTLVNTSPKGEPQLGKRGLYPSVGAKGAGPDQMALLWVLNQSDGDHSLLDIAESSGQAYESISTAARALEQTDLLVEKKSS